MTECDGCYIPIFHPVANDLINELFYDTTFVVYVLCFTKCMCVQIY